MKQPSLSIGDSKYFMCEIKLLPNDKKLQDNEKTFLCMNAVLNALSIETKKTVEKKASLELLFLNPGEEVKDIEINEEVEINYMKSKGGEVIGKSCQLAEEGNYDQASKFLNDFIEEINKSKFQAHHILVKVKEDCESSKNLCKPNIFEQQGKAFMYKKEMNHIERKNSCNALEELNECEKEVIDDYEKGNLALSSSEVADTYQKDTLEAIKVEEGSLKRKFSDCDNEDNRSMSDEDIQQLKNESIPEQKVSLECSNLLLAISNENHFGNDIKKQEKIEKKEVKMEDEKSDIIEEEKK